MDYDNDTDFNQSFFSNETKPECEEYDMHILHVSLLPAVFIILLLSLLERRKKVYDCERRLACLRGRFGVVVPVDFMSTLENRWSYAFAFGAVAQHMMCLILQLSNPLPIDLPDYLEVLKMMLAALMVGISCKPLFICLSTKHRLLGSVLGLLYSIFWFSMQLWELIWCSDSTAQKGGIKDYLWKNEWLLDLQLLLCLGFLVCRFGFLIVIEILIYLKKYNKKDEVQKEYYKYVQRLLLRPAERSVEKSWFQRKVYEWDPYFKFPNRIIATVVLSFFTLYLMIIFEQAVSPQFFVDLFILYDEYLQDFISELDFTEYINYIKYAWYVSAACAAFMSVICVSRVLVCYRKHIKSMWAGEKKYLPRKYKLNPTDSLGGLLAYPGFQIAFTLWGYVIIHLAMFVGILVLILVIMEVVVSSIEEFGFFSWLNDRTIFLLNFLVVLAVDRLQQMLIHMFFLQDKNSSMDKDKPLALNNRKVFHNVNYFLFFFNVIMGLLSCVMRLIRSTAVGLMLLTSIDRAIMPRGFEELDKSITETFLLTHYSLMKLMAKVI